MSLQFRRDSEANITQFNPVLKEGEPLWDLDNKKLYIGDGVTNAVQLDSITGVTDSEVATVLNSLLTEGSSPNVNFVYDTGEDVFNISLDFAIPFDQEIRSTAGFVGSLIGDDSSTVFEASESAFVNLEEAFLTTVGPRTDNVFDIGSDTKRFSTGFFHNINVKDQSTVEDLNINGLIKSEDSSVLFDSRTNTLSASIIVGNLTGDVTAQTITADDIKAGNVLLSENNINLETGNTLSISSDEPGLDEELFELKIFGETTIEGVTDGITPSLCFNVNAFKEDNDGDAASLIEGDFIGGVKFSAFDTVTSDYFTKAFVSARIDTATQNNALPGRIEFIVEDTNGNFSSAASITARGTVDATAFVAKAFANAAARDEALTDTTQPTAVPGTIVFVTDIAGAAKFQGWTGSEWVDLN